jgi:asparagine synthetase B (glutamine-hydrolysing)
MIAACIGGGVDSGAAWFERLGLRTHPRIEPSIRIGYSEGAEVSVFDDGGVAVVAEATAPLALHAAKVAQEYSQRGLLLERRLPAVASFILHDRGKRRSLIANGLLSDTPLCFFGTSHGSVVVCSRVGALLRHREAPRSLNELYLAHLLTGWGAMAAGHTAVEGIKRLRFGRALIVEPEGTSERIVDRLEALSLPNRGARIEAFWTALCGATRVATGPASGACLSLSGGVDSAALVCAMVSPDRPLNAFSVVAPRLDASAEEPGLQSMEREFGGMRLSRIDASEVAAYPNTESFDVRDDPPLLPMALLAARMHMWSAAAAAGIRTVFEGEGGDELFSTLATPLDALLHGEWWTLLRQLRVRSGRRSLLQWSIALPLSPSAVRTPLARRWGRGLTGLPPFANKHVSSKQEVMAAMEQFLAGLVHVPFRTRVERWLDSPMTVAAASSRVHYASRWGVALAWPLLDRAVIELVLGLPPDDLLSQEGEDKSFLRMALRDRVPDAVRTRSKDVRLYHVLVSRMLGSAQSFRVIRDENVRRRLSEWIDFDALETMLHAAGARRIGRISLLWQLECVVSFADWYARASREWGIQ